MSYLFLIVAAERGSIKKAVELIKKKESKIIVSMYDILSSYINVLGLAISKR